MWGIIKNIEMYDRPAKSANRIGGEMGLAAFNAPSRSRRNTIYRNVRV